MSCLICFDFDVWVKSLIGGVSRTFHSGIFPGGRPLGDFAFQELMPSLKCSERLPEAWADRMNGVDTMCLFSVGFMGCSHTVN